MKSFTAYAVVQGLVVSALYCFQPATAGGTLSFLSLYSYTSVYGYDSLSGYISTSGGFPFGTGSVFGVYVSTNGYIGMGSAVSSYDIPGGYNVVVPYGANINPNLAGTVRYTAFSSDYSQRNTVSSFIRSQSSNYFYGTRMMIAEWNGVPQYSGSSYTTVRFQAVLITDGTSSYAVFIYDCGGMEWGGAEIGWQYNSSLYREHYLSGSSSASIGCQYSSTYSAIVYRLDPDCYYNEFTCDNGNCEPASYECDEYDDCGPGDNSDEEYCNNYTPSPSPTPTSSYCYSYEWQCDNGECIPRNWVCDGGYDCYDNSDEYRGCDYYDYYYYYNDHDYCYSYSFECDNGRCVSDAYECDGDNDCGDNSDEENCSDTNIGLAVGLSVGLFFFLVFIATPFCLVVGIYYASRSRARTVRTRVVASTPPAGTTVVTSGQTNETSFVAQPAAFYPAQQHQKPDAQLTNQLPPPSYAAAAAYPPQGYPQYQSNPVAGYPPQQGAPYPTNAYVQQGYPQAAPYPYPYPGYPPPNQAPAPQPDGAEGVAASAGVVLQQ